MRCAHHSGGSDSDPTNARLRITGFSRLLH